MVGVREDNNEMTQLLVSANVWIAVSLPEKLGEADWEGKGERLFQLVALKGSSDSW